MRAVFIALLTLAASAVATPIVTKTQLEARQLETQADEIDKLFALVQTHTTKINATTASYPDNPSLAQQNEAAAALAPDLNAITEALTAATATLSKRAVSEIFARTGGKTACPKDCLLIKVQLLVWEIACTIKFIIIKLGLACVLHLLTPLILALAGLVKCLEPVVVGLLIVVKSLLTYVLGTVAGALLALIIW